MLRTINKIISRCYFAESHCDVQLRMLRQQGDVIEMEKMNILKQKASLFEQLDQNEKELVGSRLARDQFFDILQFRAIIQKKEADLDVILFELHQQQRENTNRKSLKQKEKTAFIRKRNKYEKWKSCHLKRQRLQGMLQQELEQEEMVQWTV